MKTIDELQEIANKVFFQTGSVHKIMYATPDGNFFYQADLNAARSHAKTGELFQLTHKGPIKPADKAGNPEDHKQDPKEYAKGVKALKAELKKVSTPEDLFKFGEENQIGTDERSTVRDAWKKAVETIGLPKPKTTAEHTPADFISMINAVTTDDALDALEAEYSLSKHENAEVIEAYEKKEDEFL